MKALQVLIRGLTASFRIPFAIAGVQATSPVPTYSNLLGLLSCCAGKNITPQHTRIGFEFTAEEKAVDLERFIRWDYNPKSPGLPKLNIEGPGIRKREFLINPFLKLYLSNLDLKECLISPKGIPTLGRSQDIVWIENVQELELEPIQQGKVGGTLIPLKLCADKMISGLIIRLPEYVTYNETVRLRESKNSETFIATNTTQGIRTLVELKECLFYSKAFESEEDVIYLHEWLEPFQN
jgi:CRISPR-associated protein Cas5t